MEQNTFSITAERINESIFIGQVSLTGDPVQVAKALTKGMLADPKIASMVIASVWEYSTAIKVPLTDLITMIQKSHDKAYNNGQ